jgi:hypothetical protein
LTALPDDLEVGGDIPIATAGADSRPYQAP